MAEGTPLAMMHPTASLTPLSSLQAAKQKEIEEATAIDDDEELSDAEGAEEGAMDVDGPGGPAQVRMFALSVWSHDTEQRSAPPIAKYVSAPPAAPPAAQSVAACEVAGAALVRLCTTRQPVKSLISPGLLRNFPLTILRKGVAPRCRPAERRRRARIRPDCVRRSASVLSRVALPQARFSSSTASTVGFCWNEPHKARCAAPP